MRTARTFVLCFVTVVCLVMCEVGWGADEDSCLALIPKTGAFAIQLSSNSSKSFDSSKAWFCSDDFVSSASQSKSSGGISIPIDGIPVGASFDTGSNSDMAARQSFCSDNSKQFSKEQNNFLFIKQGDPTIVNAFVNCEGLRTKNYLHVVGTQKTDATFEVDVDSKPYPGESPLIVEVDPVLNAKPLVVTSFQPGSKIPFEGIGAGPVTGTYAFDGSEAIVLVRTTIGDQTVDLKRCGRGNAGTWDVTDSVEHDTETPDGKFTWSQDVPQPGCHPHCNPDQGDWHYYTVQSPDSDILRNPTVACSAGGCQFDEFHADLITSQTIKVSARSRSAAAHIIVTADKIRLDKSLVHEKSAQGNLVYANPFSFTLLTEPPSVLGVHSAEGDLQFTADTIRTGTLPKWLVSVGLPQQLSDHSFIYTLQILDGTCQ
jgi:hypothetical protein